MHVTTRNNACMCSSRDSKPLARSALSEDTLPLTGLASLHSFQRSMKQTFIACDDVIDFRPAPAIRVVAYGDRYPTNLCLYVLQREVSARSCKARLFNRFLEPLEESSATRSCCEKAAKDSFCKNNGPEFCASGPRAYLHQLPTFRKLRVPHEQLAKLPNMSDEMDLDGSSTKRAV